MKSKLKSSQSIYPLVTVGDVLEPLEHFKQPNLQFQNSGYRYSKYEYRGSIGTQMAFWNSWFIWGIGTRV
ncbi:hypothetical protein V6N11_051598 [Hibiscus sabdariffa]|uniref:NADH-plastoquinone oxidoreductase subunit K n=1 Tax=Hibiscus sabdariffa TaxID=183260 RepID=A0ABR2U7S7_9ROSI